MMSKPKYIVILTGLFCRVVASGTSHFYSFFPYIFWQGLIFDMTIWAFDLASQDQAKNEKKGNDQELVQSNLTSLPQNQKGKKDTHIDNTRTANRISSSFL